MGLTGRAIDPISSSRGGANVEFEQFQRQQRAVYEAQQNASLGQSFENRSTEGTYASAISQSAPMNRFQRTRMEEEEDLRKAIEASLNEAHEQGTSSVLPAGERGNETSPVISTQPAESMPPILETMGLNKKGFVGGLVASIFEVG
jgi:O-acetyl-ADP-ribose deacetylase (regulator of RNase III)